MLHLSDADKKPERIDGELHDGARRLEGGMAQLIDALAADLPPDRWHFDHVLTDISDRDDHVVLTFAAGDDIVEVEARHVVLALPPRLLEQQVRFEPALDEATQRVHARHRDLDGGAGQGGHDLRPRLLARGRAIGQRLRDA